MPFEVLSGLCIDNGVLEGNSCGGNCMIEDDFVGALGKVEVES